MEKVDKFKVFSFRESHHINTGTCVKHEHHLIFFLLLHKQVGDWVRVKTSVPSPKYGWDDVPRSSIGIIFSLEEDGDVDVAFCFRSKTFPCSVTDIEKVPPFEVGQEVHILPSVTQPLLGWSDETPASSGKIERIDMDGTLNVSSPTSFFSLSVDFSR